MVQYGRSSRSSWTKSVRSLFRRTIMEKAIRESCIGTRRRNVPKWECLFVKREKGLFLSVYVDDIKMTRKKQNLDPMWKILMKDVDLGETTPFFDHVYLGCTQRECKTSKHMVNNYRDMFEFRMSAGDFKIFLFGEIWSTHFFMVLWRVRSCKEMCGMLLRAKRPNSYIKSQFQVLTTINSKKKK